MPQEIRVVKCFRCDIFQGDIIKKAKTWQCKICGEKQSIMQEFGRGTGKECRQHIQKLNLKMRNEETAIANKLQNDINDFYEPIAENVENLSKEQLMLPLLVNSNLSNSNTRNDYGNLQAENSVSISYNANANDSKNINYSNEQDNQKVINFSKSDPSPSNTVYDLSKCSNNDKNLKRNSRENADILSKKSKWSNFVTENEK